MPSSKKDTFLTDDKTLHRALFIAATLLVAGICTFTPRGIFKDYDAKERSKQDESVRDLETRKWQRDQEDLHHQETRSRGFEDDEPLPSRRARYTPTRDGRRATPQASDWNFQDSNSQNHRHHSHHRAQSPKKEEKDPFS